MGTKGKKIGKGSNKKGKNDLPVLDTDHDFLKEFEKSDKSKSEEIKLENPKPSPLNKHGVQILTSFPEEKKSTQTDVDFAQLLEESFKKGRKKKVKKKSMPLKKRLKRYPPVEAQLDLHGYTAVGAQVKAESFIRNCKHQGFFTLRIIVGKGLHSDLGPVLPDVVEGVVKQMKKQGLVIFFEWDKKKKSKSGAILVYLKQFEQFD